MKKYDAIIIGSGQGGTPLAKKMAGAGYKTALIEKRWVGGTCVNDGCTPTKAMIASAKTAHTVRSSSALGISIGRYSVDIAKIIARQQKIVTSFREGSEKGLVSTDNLELIFGEASFTDHKKLVVKKNSGDSEVITSDLIFIDTGTKPSVPDIEGLKSVPYLTSSSILELKEIPQHLLIVGGGYIAMEFAQMYRRFGSKVTMLEHAERILRKEDEDIASEVHQIFLDEGIDIRLDAQAVSFRNSNNKIEAAIKVTDREEMLVCSHVLIATGRKPNTDSLNLPAVGVNTNEKGFIRVDNQLQTNIKGLYALGDVNGGPAFTHISYHDHLIVYDNVVNSQNKNTNNRLVPYCIYIDPQLARVGITEQEAKAKNLNVKVATLPMAKVARAIETSETRGTMKVVVDAANKKILGASILGVEGGEIMSIIEIAIMGGVTYDTIRDAIFAHPTYAESLNNLFGTLDK